MGSRIRRREIRGRLELFFKERIGRSIWGEGSGLGREGLEVIVG